MSIELSPETEKRICEAVQAGLYASPAQLVEVAVRSLLDAIPGRVTAARDILCLDPPLIAPAGRRLNLSNEQLYDRIGF